MNDRELTEAERRWIVRLKRCLDDMPKDLEITVRCCGTVVVHEIGSRDRYFAEHGHVDDVPALTEFRPKTAKRIGGRDSHL